MVLGILALTVAAVFSGAALYVSFVEHPSRDALDARGQLIQWKPSYARGARMQASLALIGFALSLLAWWQTKDLRWMVGAIVLVAGWPYTMLCIMSVNNALKATALGDAGPASGRLLARWGRLHAGRTALGVVSTAIYIAAAGNL
ncbi:MAG: DUF1772 domain-containing protein [Alphaproteobacteria bacterium]|nr:DUF1772 domain-containing protein [Alphaproteobacteria bacterium]